MYQIHFLNKSDIRMGSPFQSATLKLSGSFVPDTAPFRFQDRSAISPDGSKCALIQWDIQENEPGFIIWHLDELHQTLKRSERLSGCCKNIALSADGQTLFLEVWSFDSKNEQETIRKVTLSF